MLVRHKTRLMIILLFLEMAWIAPLWADQAGNNAVSLAEVAQKAQKIRIPFIANAGQTDERVRFYANTFCGNVLVTKTGGIVYALPRPEKIRDNPPARPEKLTRKSLLLHEELVGGRIDKIEGKGKTLAQVNFFKGNNSAMWKSNVPTYETVSLGEVYNGITLELKAYGRNVEKLFSVEPAANPELIKIRLRGAQSLRVNEAGQLQAETAFGDVTFTKPRAYQLIDGRQVEVEVEYVLGKRVARNKMQEAGSKKAELISRKAGLFSQKSKIRNLSSTQTCPRPGEGIGEQQLEYGFKVANYDKTRELVIDPLLASTYLGGYHSDYGSAIALDSRGNVYVAGYTESPGFPTTSGAFNTSYRDGDVFVAKFDKDLTKLLASTFIGGHSGDYVRSMAIDSGGNVYIAGQTSSSNFPTTDGAYDTRKDGYSDIFLVKFNDGLTSLLASTYLGGASDDYAQSIAVDPEGTTLYVVGRTLSSNFPTTPDAYDTSYNSNDAFVSRLSRNLTHLLASTYLGGHDNDYANSIVIGPDRHLYVSGETWSSDFPTTPGAYDTSFNGGFGDVFVSKLNWGLTNLAASTFLGGASDECATSAIMDSHGNIYVTGDTESPDFPTTRGAYDTSFHNGDTFISKFNWNLTQLQASTFLGGSDDDYGCSIARNPGGNIYVAGYTGSTDFPTTVGAYDTSKSVFFEVFVSKLSGDLVKLIASTFLGGRYRDFAHAAVVNSEGSIYVTGETKSFDFPATQGVFDASYNGDIANPDTFDVFISKLDSSLSAQP